MKNLIPLSALALLILFGCAKEETTPANLSMDRQLSQDQSFYFTDLNSANQELKELSFEGLDFDQLVLASNTAATKKNTNTHANGHVTVPNGTDLVFSAMENKGGIHGQVNISGESTDIHLDVNCICVIDNQAYIGGLITQSTIGPPVGAYTYFGVEDNGEGNNAAADRVSFAFFSSPVELDLTNELFPPGLPPLQGCEAAAFIFANLLPPGVEDAFVDGIDPTQVQVSD